jgi:3'(2'), 5'-bisphosphate nucleotidase
MMDLTKELTISKDLAIKAGKEILNIYNSNNFEITNKNENNYTSPLTIADTKANEIIVTKLREEFPNYAILTEEEKDDKARLNNDFVWIIDPLDGTKEFIKKNDEFTVNIALVYKNEIILGVIYVPVTNELYYATKNNGSYLQEQKISVSANNNQKDMILVKSRSHASEKLLKIIDNFKDTIEKGSSLKGCIIANGKADLYPRLGPINEWDICAMDIIIKEAGGTLTDLEGKDLKYNKITPLITSGFLVTNNKIHKELLDVINND